MTDSTLLHQILETLPKPSFYIEMLGSAGTIPIFWVIAIMLCGFVGFISTFFGLNWIREKANNARGMFVRSKRETPLVLVGIIVGLICGALVVNQWGKSLERDRVEQAQALVDLLDRKTQIRVVTLDAFDQNVVIVETEVKTEVLGTQLTQRKARIRLPLQTAQLLDDKFFKPQGLALR